MHLGFVLQSGGFWTKSLKQKQTQAWKLWNAKLYCPILS